VPTPTFVPSVQIAEFPSVVTPAAVVIFGKYPVVPKFPAR
jgi:hypothetical protein